MCACVCSDRKRTADGEEDVEQAIPGESIEGEQTIFECDIELGGLGGNSKLLVNSDNRLRICEKVVGC